MKRKSTGDRLIGGGGAAAGSVALVAVIEGEYYWFTFAFVALGISVLIAGLIIRRKERRDESP